MLITLKGTIQEFIDRHGGGVVKCRKRRDLGNFNLDVDRIFEDDRYQLNLTRKEREMQFWKFDLPGAKPVFLMNGNDKIFL